MFFDDGERVRIVALANPLLPKALLGREGFIEYPAGNVGLCFGPSPFYWVRLSSIDGRENNYFCASVAELELIA